MSNQIFSGKQDERDSVIADYRDGFSNPSQVILIFSPKREKIPPGFSCHPCFYTCFNRLQIFSIFQCRARVNRHRAT